MWTIAAWVWLAAFTPGALFAAEVRVETLEGVRPEAAALVNKALDAALALFTVNYALELDHDVKVVLTSNQNQYVNALIRERIYTPGVAASQARDHPGVSGGSTIVQDLGRTRGWAPLFLS